MSRIPIYREAQTRLRDFITEQGLRPGDRLPSEAALADRLGVNRLSLREATRSLQALGVIEAQQGNGLFVAQFSLAPLIEQLPYGLATPGTTLDEVLTAREAMEVGLIPAVVRSADSVNLTRCEQLAHTMIELEAAGQSTVEVDKEFHLQLYKSLDNPLVDNLIEVFWDLFVKLGDAIPAPEDARRGERHMAIVRALQAQDPAASLVRMQEHFADVRKRAADLPPQAQGSS